MTLKVGDTAPAFDLTASDGRRLVLSELRGQKNVVIYFYPRDFTAVCTAEACGFRDQYPDLSKKDTEVIGVSGDGGDSHTRFASELKLPFPLVSDPDKSLAKAYGCQDGLLAAVLGRTSRVTYVIDKQGKIAGVFDSQFLAGQHTQGVKKLIDTLAAR